MQTSVEILETLTASAPIRAIRSDRLLKPPDAESGSGWRMHVPPCFNTSLDIRQTPRIKDKAEELVWTQGSWFAFERGDVLYDAAEGYHSWSAMRFSLCVQVRQARAVSISNDKRDPGLIGADLFKPDRIGGNRLEKIGSETFTQDSFIRFLITGQFR